MRKRVAICDQLEDPKQTKKLVKRGITELVTPGVSINDTILNHRENNFLCSIHIGKNNRYGIAFLDISTGEFLTTEGDNTEIDKLLTGFTPKEVLVERKNRKKVEETFSRNWLLSEQEDWVFTEESARDRLLGHFDTKSLKGFGVEHLPLGIIASGAILHYLDLTQHTQIGHINALRRIEEKRFMRLDPFTVRSLELVAPMNEGGKTLLSVLEKTISPMGSRLLRRWLLFPLKEEKEIEERLNIVEHFFRQPTLKELLSKQIAQVGDLERIISKAAVGRITPREVVQLKVALIALGPIREGFLSSGNKGLEEIGKKINPCEELSSKIDKELVADPPALTNKGGFIANGMNKELDKLREIAYSSKDYLMQMQQREVTHRNSSLKIAFNNVFGYYLGYATHKDKVPRWIRKQTLVSAALIYYRRIEEYEEKYWVRKKK